MLFSVSTNISSNDYILSPGLLISRKLVDLAVVGVLITYFSDSKYSELFTLQKAAIFTSIQDGILPTLAVVAAWMSCYAIRPLKSLIFSTVSYILVSKYVLNLLSFQTETKLKHVYDLQEIYIQGWTLDFVVL